MREKGENKDPHKKYDEDLWDLLKQFNDQGHNIILMGDFNLPIYEANSFTTGKKKNLRLILSTAKGWGFDYRWEELSVKELKKKVEDAKKQYVIYTLRVHEYR